MSTATSEVVHRPKRLLRASLSGAGVLFVVIGGLFFIRATRNPDLTALDGWAAWLAAPLKITSELPERMTAIFAVTALALGLLLIFVAGWISWWVRTQRVEVGKHDLDVAPRLINAELARTPVSEKQAFIFWQSLHDPTARYSRISETIEMGTRSFRVATSISVVTTDMDSEVHAIPVALFTRGRLENGLSFHSSARISSLSHVQAAAYAAAVVERLVRSAGRGAIAQYNSEPLGYRSLKARVVEVVTCTTPGGVSEAAEIARAVASLPCPKRRQPTLIAAATVIKYLAEQYPVCVWVNAEGTDGSARITMDRVVIPSLRHYARDVQGVRKRLERFRKRLIDVQRSMFGVTTHTVDYPTQMARRTASYHLNVRGPEGFYLAHQELRDDANVGRTLNASQLTELSYAMNPRRGQRTGHLYARSGQQFRDLLYSCAFYERMPGSMSTAFVGAITTTLVAVAVAYAVLLSEQGEDQSGLLQILLAFPLALTATSSFRSGSPFWGGDLGARWATVVTVGVLTGCLLASTVGTGSSREAQVVYWSILLVVSATNTLVCLVAWLSRVATYHSFLGR